MSHRLVVALVAVLMLVSGQEALAKRDAGVVRTLVDLATAECHNPEGIAVAPDGTLFAGGLSGNICVISDREVTRVIPVTPGPAGVTNLLGMLFQPGHGIFVADIADFGTSAAGRVLLVDPKTGDVQTLADGLLGPNGIAQDRHGDLYVSDSFAGAIWKVDPDGGGKTLWFQDPRLTTKGMPAFGANGVAFDKEERFLYVANTGDSAILRIAVARDGNADGLEVFAQGATGDDPDFLHGADGIAFDVKGQLWVCANQENEIQVLSPDGKLVASYSGTGDDAMDFPASLVFRGRTLYVANLAFGHFGGKISVMRAPFPGAPLSP